MEVCEKVTTGRTQFALARAVVLSWQLFRLYSRHLHDRIPLSGALGSEVADVY